MLRMLTFQSDLGCFRTHIWSGDFNVIEKVL